MPSQIQILTKAVADADRQNRTATDDLTARTEAVNTTTAKIEDLQRRYDVACLEAAKGNEKAEDPSGLQAEIQRHQHRLRGESQMHQDALKAHGDANRKLVEATNALQDFNEREELQRLKEAVQTAKANVAAAEAGLKEANEILAAAKRAHGQLDRKLDPSLRSALNVW